MSKLGAQIWNPRSTADRGTSGEQAAPRARHQDYRGNASKVAFLRQLHGAARRDLTRGSVHAPWCPLSPINTLKFSELRKKKLRGVLRIVFKVFFSML